MVILPAILRHLRYHIKNRDDLLDKSLEAMGSILMLLHDQELVSGTAAQTCSPSLIRSPSPGPAPQSAVDEEIRVMVWEMLQVLLNCFTQLTGRNEKVSSVVVSPAPVLSSAPSHSGALSLRLIPISCSYSFQSQCLF